VEIIGGSKLTALSISRQFDLEYFNFECEYADDGSGRSSNRLTYEAQDMRRHIVSRFPMESSQICFSWSWYFDGQPRRNGLPSTASIIRERAFGSGCSITIELRAMNDPVQSPVSANIPILTAERISITNDRRESYPATPKQIENMSRLGRCAFNAHSPFIKCAVNPAIACSDCTHFEESHDDV